jgi:4-diphosphocytidyl-2-C-methyl-D-erythritol kinase
MPLTQVTEFAFAKVNLTLHVTGQRDDGYHLLDSLVAFCGIGDRLHASVANTLSLTLEGPFARDVPTDMDNLVMQAAKQFAGDMGVAFTLKKHLPPASGIGGGSADAAAAIRAVLRLREKLGLPNEPENAEALAGAVLALGADVPVCLLSAAARMRGIGEKLDFIGPLPAIHIVLVNPRVAVPTPAVFKALTARQNPPMPDTLPAWDDARALAKWLKTQRNDLEPPALAIAPVIGDVLARLAAQPGALIARMSGSGATCFALFETEHAASAAVDAIGAAQPDWWAASGPVYSGSGDWAQLIRATT